MGQCPAPKVQQYCSKFPGPFHAVPLGIVQVYKMYKYRPYIRH